MLPVYTLPPHADTLYDTRARVKMFRGYDDCLRERRAAYADVMSRVSALRYEEIESACLMS